MSGRTPDSRPDDRTTLPQFDGSRLGLYNDEFSCAAETPTRSEPHESAPL